MFTRRKERTTVTTTDSPELTAENVDPESPVYVPEPLRPYFRAAPFDRLDQREAHEQYGDAARAWWVRHDPELRARVMAHGGRWYDPDTRPDGSLLWDLHGEAARTLPPLDEREQQRAEHVARLVAADHAYRTALDAEHAEQERLARACPACGDHVPTTLSRVIVPGTIPADDRLCPPCRLVAGQQRVDLAAADVVRDGRTRAELVAGWLA